jgi:raffinose/stachyose/melibiose transport system substrate-binding protein
LTAWFAHDLVLSTLNPSFQEAQEMKKTLWVLGLLLVFAFAPTFAGGSSEQTGEVVLNWPTIWVGEDSKAPTIAALVEQFNADNAGKFRVMIEPNPDYDGYRTKINTSIAAGRVPDLFVFNPDPTSFQYYEGDLLFDFTKELKGSWARSFVDGTIADATRNGVTKSVPYEIAITPIWYNSALFERAGVAEFPETLEEFWAACDKLKAAGIAPTSQMTGGTNAWTSMLWYSHLLASLGGPSVWEKSIDDPIYVEAAEIMKRMYEEYTTKDAVGGDAGVSGGHYMAGRTAIFINGPWYIGRIREQAPDVYVATNLAPAPKVPGGKHGGQIGFPLSNLAAGNTENSARRDAVVAFMKWMTRPENVKTVSLDAGSLFAIKYELAPGEQVDPLQAKFIAAAAGASYIVGGFHGKYDVQVVAEVGQALGAMALGRATPEQFVQMLKDAM